MIGAMEVRDGGRGEGLLAKRMGEVNGGQWRRDISDKLSTIVSGCGHESDGG